MDELFKVDNIVSITTTNGKKYVGRVIYCDVNTEGEVHLKPQAIIEDEKIKKIHDFKFIETVDLPLPRYVIYMKFITECHKALFSDLIAFNAPKYSSIPIGSNMSAVVVNDLYLNGQYK